MGKISDVFGKSEVDKAAGGNGHDKQESETPIADEELKQYCDQKQGDERQHPDEEEELVAIKLTKQDIDFMFQTMMKAYINILSNS
jgi:hypothetical protein